MSPDELVRTCEFETPRLRMRDWHAAEVPAGTDLPSVVSAMLTPATTRALPPQWQGVYSQERARRWIEARDRESSTLLVADRDSALPVGLVILFAATADGLDDEIDLRIGYLFAEAAWGHGLASELVDGLVGWCRSQPMVRSIAGGVADDNVASARVLTKNGFTTAGSTAGGDLIYELRLRG